MIASAKMEVNMSKKIQKKDEMIQVVYAEIQQLIQAARDKVYQTANFEMVKAYWEIGKRIVEEEQQGEERAEYGKYLIKELSKRLQAEFGSGFNETNLRYMRLFYQKFPIRHALRDELSWTHYRLLLSEEKEIARDFYLVETIKNKWSTRELDRQIDTMLFERVALSKDRDGVKQLAKQGQELLKPADAIKDPYVLEFLNVKEGKKLSEKDLESALIEKMEAFLLELGRGFCFVARQKRLSTEFKHYYVDLVFYNNILKCYVLIDLKVTKLDSSHVSQMDMYVRMYDDKHRLPDDNPTIGIVLCTKKDDALVRYSILNESEQIFASKYMTYLPSEEELKREILREKHLIESEKKLKKNLE